MATIIELSPHLMRADQLRKGKTRPEGLAEIVIFPGVRYERYGDTSSTRHRERDLIEISEG